MQIVIEPNIESISWFKGITDRLAYFASRKKYAFERFESVAEIPSVRDKEPVILIGSSYEWLDFQVTTAQKLEKHPVLISNQPSAAFSGDYSYISVNLKATVEDLLYVFRKAGLVKTALFGVNPSSLADIGRLEAFSLNCGVNHVFYNYNGLVEAAEEFAKVCENYDSVICVNSFAAVILYKYLKSHKRNSKNIILASLNYSEILFSVPNIIAVSFDFEEHLKAALKIHTFLKQNTYLSGMRATVKHSLILPDSLKALVKEENDANAKDEKNLFLCDGFLHALSKADVLLSACDSIDKKIILLLLKGNTYSEIADYCYISEYTVKYRIKNMMKICGIPSKKAFVQFLKKYV